MESSKLHAVPTYEGHDLLNLEGVSCEANQVDQILRKIEWFFLARVG